MKFKKTTQESSSKNLKDEEKEIVTQLTEDVDSSLDSQDVDYAMDSVTMDETDDFEMYDDDAIAAAYEEEYDDESFPVDTVASFENIPFGGFENTFDNVEEHELSDHELGECVSEYNSDTTIETIEESENSPDVVEEEIKTESVKEEKKSMNTTLTLREKLQKINEVNDSVIQEVENFIIHHAQTTNKKNCSLVCKTNQEFVIRYLKDQGLTVKTSSKEKDKVSLDVSWD